MDRLIGSFPSWNHDHIQDELIDRQGLPFGEAVFADQIPAVVSEGLADIVASPVPTDQISAGHARSYEIGRADQVTALWQDQFGNAYTSLSLKGNNFSTPDIFESLTAPSGYIPKGLQEDDALLRLVRASRLLRERRIPTEWVVGVMEPREIAYGALGRFSQAEYKKQLLIDKLGEQPIEEAGRIAAAIMPMSFFVTARAMEINDRPIDFLRDETPEAVLTRLNKVFTVYNLTHRRDERFQPLDSSSATDRRYYFTNLLPRLRGANLARLHEAGLVHVFPVDGNVTALGGIVDLDSVHGEPLGIGDEPITAKQRVADMTAAFDADLGGIRHIHDHVERMHIIGGTTADNFDRYAESYLKAYRANRGANFDNHEELMMIGQIYAYDTVYISKLPKRLARRVDRLTSHAVDCFEEVAERLGSIWWQTYERNRQQKAEWIQPRIDRRLFAAIQADERISSMNFMTQLAAEGLYEVARATSEISMDTVEQDWPAEVVVWLDRLGMSVDRGSSFAQLMSSTIFHAQIDHLLKTEVLNTDLDVAVQMVRQTAGTLAEAIAQGMIVFLPDDAQELQPSDIAGLYLGKPYFTTHYESYEQFRGTVMQSDQKDVVVWHDDEATDIKMMSDLDCVQYVSDAEEFYVQQIHVEDRGNRYMVQPAGRNGTFAAFVTRPDSNGKVHIYCEQLTTSEG